MSGVLDTLAAATPTRHSVTLCLDGALQAEWDAALDRLDDAADQDKKRSLADIPATTSVVEDMESLRERMAGSKVTFYFERLPWTERVALQAAHPPREKNLIDTMRGYNVETFLPILIRRSCVEVTKPATGDTSTEIPDATWDGLLGTPATDDEPAKAGSLNYKQVEMLATAAQKVNDGETSVPPSARSLLGNQDSGASLAQPSPGQARPRSGGKGGSRRGSPRSSTTKRAPSKARSAGT